MLQKVFLPMIIFIFQSGYWKIDYVYVILHYLNSNFALSILVEIILPLNLAILFLHNQFAKLVNLF